MDAINNDSIRFKLPESLKREFFALCEENSQTPSIMLRRWVSGFVAGDQSGLAKPHPRKTHKVKP